MTHKCSYECFEKYQDQIRQHVEIKVQHYVHTDDAQKFIDCCPTINPDKAYNLLLESKGKCCLCTKQLTLHNWTYRSPTQFSFDRLDDDDSHHIDNLQITCLSCNTKKADDVFFPNYGKSFDEYTELVRNFLLINRLIKNGDVENSRELRQYLNQLRPYLAHLHNLVYEDRKPNGWFRYDKITNIRPNSVAPVYYEMFIE
jgi:hypothetical protein